MKIKLWVVETTQATYAKSNHYFRNWKAFHTPLDAVQEFNRIAQDDAMLSWEDRWCDAGEFSGVQAPVIRFFERTINNTQDFLKAAEEIYSIE